MSDDEFVTLARYPDEMRASVVRSQLEAAGIRTFLHGGQMVTSLWHVGPALGGVELKVAAVDAQKAVDFLREELGEETVFDQGSSRWLCPDCGEMVDDLADDCPMCGAGRPAAEELSRARGLSEEELTAAALANGEILDDEDEEPSEEQEAEVDHDAVATRAFRAAIFGLFFPPILIYALVLVVQLPGHQLSSRGRMHRMLATLIVCIAVFGFAALLLGPY